jgi:tungstate transport system substrate-binding protein
MKNIFFLLLIIIFISCFKENTLTICTTTSIYDSGLLDLVIMPFEKKEKCRIKVISSGSGEAIRNARDGIADIIFVHEPYLEIKLIKDGIGVKRYSIMKNYFVLVGPKKNSIEEKKATKQLDIINMFKSIASNNLLFVSRGDDSGTHKKELEIWERCGLLNQIKKYPKWYIESGSGMITTLRIANEKKGYCLTDIATFLIHQKELNNLQVILNKDKYLENIYSIIPISKEKFQKVNYNLAMKFVEYIINGEGKKIIMNFGKEKFNRPLFEFIYNGNN